MNARALLPTVSARFGAPMGRLSAPSLHQSPRSVRLFHVPLDSGGYDCGGAYWGLGAALYCATDDTGAMQFVRASSRLGAAIGLDLAPRSLVAPLRIPPWWRELPAVVDYLEGWGLSPD